MGLKYKITAFLGIALFHLFVSFAFAGLEDSYVYPDQIEEELRRLQSSNSTEDRSNATWKFHNSMRDGIIVHNHPQVIHALENALTDTSPSVIKEALAALRYTNASSAKNAVERLLTNEGLPLYIRKHARDVFYEIQDNQKSFEQFLEDFEGTIGSDLKELAFDMTRFFDREKISPHFRNVLNGSTEFRHDYDRKIAVMRAIALSRDETLQNAFFHDFLQHAKTSDNFGLGNGAISYLNYFDWNLTLPHLLSIIEDKHIDEIKKKEAIGTLFYKLPPELFDVTVRKIRDGIKDDPFSGFLADYLDGAIETWKKEHQIDETPAEETKGNNEKTNEDQSPSSEENPKEVMPPCTEASKESHLEEMAKNTSEITERLESSLPAENQRKNDANDRELIRVHLEDKEIEKQLRNAVEGYEIATQQYEVAVEPIVKEIIRLHGEIYGPAPLTVKRALTEVAETFKVVGSLTPILKEIIEFRTDESRQMEIRKKEFEIRKKEREIFGPAIEELKTSYNEAVRFFNSYSSIQENKFYPIYLNEWELPAKSREMLSEFSNFRSSQKK